jgi:large subunit ribosomal protein L30
MAKKEKVRIQLVRSLIGVPEKQRRVVRALGLRKRGSTVVKERNPVIDGMIFKVSHLVQTERVDT